MLLFDSLISCQQIHTFLGVLIQYSCAKYLTRHYPNTVTVCHMLCVWLYIPVCVLRLFYDSTNACVVLHNIILYLHNMIYVITHGYYVKHLNYVHDLPLYKVVVPAD